MKMKPNESNKKRTKRNKKKEIEWFEHTYCKVCRINHDKGRGHNYYPTHIKSLSSYLSKFKSKLQHVFFFLSNPISLIPNLSHHNRIWCVFCDIDLLETPTSFPCGNAINHLAGADHLKNLKSFMWKYGGKMDQVDSFRISEADLAKWEKKCKSLISGAAGVGSGRPLIGPSNDIHNELNSEYIDNNEKNSTHFISSSFSNNVMPLQYQTNERYQACNSEISEVTGVSIPYNAVTSHLSAETHFEANPQGSNNSAGYMGSQQLLVCIGKKLAGDGYSNGKAHADTRMLERGSSSQGLYNLTQISSVVQANEGNVHTGAPPPWFDLSEKSLLEVEPKSESRGVASSLKKSGKLQKLNPKRVGAAWAEKRKIELEMEKKGEIVANNFDDNWLPNFGRVWQTGTRKESKKEFDTEKKNSSRTETQSEASVEIQSYVTKEASVEIQPYVSKRKRTDTSNEVAIEGIDGQEPHFKALQFTSLMKPQIDRSYN